MRFGVMIDHQYERGSDLGRKIGELIELVQHCRDLGYDGIFGIHHYLANLTTLQPATLLARLIDHSGTMDLGTSILIGTLAHPIHIAEEMATLDQLSGGRLVLGLGSGYRDDEFQSFGIDRSVRTPRLREAIDVIRLLWSGERISYHGEHFDISEQVSSVTPARTPQPPIWVAANSPGGIRRAARWGLPWLAPANVKRNWAVGNLAAYHEVLAETAHAGAVHDFPINRNLSIADDRERATSMVMEHVRRSYGAYSGYGLDYFETKFDDIAAKAFFFGDADELSEQLRDYGSAGYDYFIFRVQWLGLEHEVSMGILERFAREVIPRFRSGGDVPTSQPTPSPSRFPPEPCP